MEYLLLIPSDYWSKFINIERTHEQSKLQQTPSTDSLLRPGTYKGYFTPLSSNRLRFLIISNFSNYIFSGIRHENKNISLLPNNSCNTIFIYFLIFLKYSTTEHL